MDFLGDLTQGLILSGSSPKCTNEPALNPFSIWLKKNIKSFRSVSILEQDGPFL
jgi:hypothetical protein